MLSIYVTSEKMEMSLEDMNSNRVKYRHSRVYKYKSSKKMADTISVSRKVVRTACQWLIIPGLCNDASSTAQIIGEKWLDDSERWKENKIEWSDYGKCKALS
jgi:hypothetical protein